MVNIAPLSRFLHLSLLLLFIVIKAADRPTLVDFALFFSE